MWFTMCMSVCMFMYPPMHVYFFNLSMTLDDHGIDLTTLC